MVGRLRLKARTARNPRTGEAVSVPAKKTVRFRPYKELREALNPGLAGKAAAEGAPAAPETDAEAPSAPAPESPARS